MKKLFFTAIALIAFSNIGSATYSRNSNLNLSEAQNCTSMYNATRVYSLQQGFSEYEAQHIACAVWLSCIGFIALP